MVTALKAPAVGPSHPAKARISVAAAELKLSQLPEPAQVAAVTQRSAAAAVAVVVALAVAPEVAKLALATVELAPVVARETPRCPA